jgi:hypothetical protein
VAVGDPGDVRRRRRRGAGGLAAWAARSAFERAQWCSAVAAAITRRGEELARALTQDQGKPLVAEADDEVDELGRYFTMAGEDAVRLAGEIPPSVSADRRVLSTRVPLGVVGVISPVELAVHDGRGAVRARARGRQRRRVGARPDHHRLLRLLAEIIAGEGTAARRVQLRGRPGPGRSATRWPATPA